MRPRLIRSFAPPRLSYQTCPVLAIRISLNSPSPPCLIQLLSAIFSSRLILARADFDVLTYARFNPEHILKINQQVFPYLPLIIELIGNRPEKAADACFQFQFDSISINWINFFLIGCLIYRVFDETFAINRSYRLNH